VRQSKPAPFLVHENEKRSLPNEKKRITQKRGGLGGHERKRQEKKGAENSAPVHRTAVLGGEGGVQAKKSPNYLLLGGRKATKRIGRGKTEVHTTITTADQEEKHLEGKEKRKYHLAKSREMMKKGDA